MSQLKRAPSKEPDPDVEETLNVNNDLDEIAFLDNDDDDDDDDEIKHFNDRLDDSTPCPVKRRHFLTDEERQSLVCDFVRRMSDDGNLKKGSIRVNGPV